MRKEYTWHDVVKKCEQILGCEDTADSPLQSNLPNLVRDLKNGASSQLAVLTSAMHSDGQSDAAEIWTNEDESAEIERQIVEDARR